MKNNNGIDKIVDAIITIASVLVAIVTTFYLGHVLEERTIFVDITEAIGGVLIRATLFLLVVFVLWIACAFVFILLYSIVAYIIDMINDHRSED